MDKSIVSPFLTHGVYSSLMLGSFLDRYKVYPDERYQQHAVFWINSGPTSTSFSNRYRQTKLMAAVFQHLYYGLT